MVTVEIWENSSGLWQGQVIDPVTGKPDFFVWTASSRGSLIAELRYRLPLTHITFVDTFRPTDP